MIASGPTPKPCMIQTAPLQTISKPTRLVTMRMTTSNARRTLLRLAYSPALMSKTR
jgi:hypothetical protein